ncbi:MAG: glycosyltransferase [Gemmatimonadetes bacterium]|nr:glycosyltransferase [Gemmatimonadota bacterium]
MRSESDVQPVATGERATSRAAPDLSVVVILFTSRAHLERCLDGLAAQRTGARLEILLPHDGRLDDDRALRDRFPAVRMVRAPSAGTPAALRAAGVAPCAAPVIALLEDHCVPAPSWAEAVLQAHRAPHAGVGGPVDKGMPPGRSRDSVLNWAVYLTDYSRYMPPMPAGPAHGLSDCNASYKRSALDTVREVWEQEFHENVVNDALARAAGTFWFEPGMLVLEQRDLTLSYAVRDRFTFGRLFGSSRVAGAPLPRRILWAAAALIMPPVLVARVAQNLIRRRRHRVQLLRCVLMLLLVAAAWMLGEATGYLTGTAHTTLAASPSLEGTP